MIYKIIFEGLRYIILIITILGMTTSSFSFNKVVLFTFLTLIASYIWSKIIGKNNNMKSKLSKIMPLIGIIVALIFSYYTAKTSLVFIIFTIIYLILWALGIKLKDEVYYNSDVFRKFIMTLLIGTLFSLDMFLGNTRWYIGDLIPYIVLFFIFSLIFSIRLNLYNAYLDNNSINKSKNLKVFNILSNLVIIISILIVVYISFGISDINLANDKINPLLEILITPLIFIASIMDKFVSKVFSNIDAKKPSQENSLNLENSDNNLIEENIRQNETAELILNYLGYFLIFMIIIILAYIIYKITKNVEENEDENNNIIIEEKEFIFDRKDIINNIKERFKKNKKNNFTNKDIHIIRLKFIEISNVMINKGHEYKKNLTPREFILQNKIDKDKSKEIISKYEKIRYGDKDINKEGIKDFIEYKKILEEE